MRSVLGSRVVVIGLSAALVVGIGGTGAVAAGLITSADIKNGTIRGVDIRDGSVGRADLGDGVVAQLGSVSTSSGTSWGIVDRNVIRDGDAYLRTGPSFSTPGGTSVVPPLGEGSLGLRTGSTNDQAAFGNQVIFVNDLVSGLTTLGFSVFTTADNNSQGPRNMPSILIEIDPNLARLPDVNQSSMVYTPRNGDANRWTAFDATDNTQGNVWGLTGPAGANTACQFVTAQCTWDTIQRVLEDGDGNPATIRSVQIVKLRDQSFSGAVDALRIRDRVFDFEPLGVNAN